MTSNPESVCQVSLRARNIDTALYCIEGPSPAYHFELRRYGVYQVASD